MIVALPGHLYFFFFYFLFLQQIGEEGHVSIFSFSALSFLFPSSSVSFFLSSHLLALLSLLSLSLETDKHYSQWLTLQTGTMQIWQGFIYS